LLGTHILQRANDAAKARNERPLGEALAQRLGDAKVNHFGHVQAIVGRHQHVGRLEVAMDHALLMGVLNGAADGSEQFESLARGKLLLIAVARDRHALDQLHDKVGPARGRGARVKHASDVGVLHHRQRLPLRLEAGDDLPCIHAGLKHFKRHRAADRLLLLGQIDHAEAAFTNLLDQFVGANLRAGAFVQSVGPERHRGRKQKTSAVVMRAQ
jgi:hypothetical protein